MQFSQKTQKGIVESEPLSLVWLTSRRRSSTRYVRTSILPSVAARCSARLPLPPSATAARTSASPRPRPGWVGTDS
ncbi:Os09g0124816 [Oryza sativa Japonica Group]|uniref:Os09g0124816 protein n=1 Tax=Oryza sativa subsp. japonica TaxID=39947 RepID=A0A0P0XJE3_ORYSJ|nr:hypothetical protein EE612_046092 [Oryza sativa]BAT06900.1 Os09g0124816 [Oryza sativa Japonica Group]